MEKPQCKCNHCVYRRWWINNKLRKDYGIKLIPRPLTRDKDFGEGTCNCRPCVYDRLRKARYRNKKYLERITNLSRRLNGKI
jgi:hypothetical protein